jgi:ATP-dependent Clp protease adaptor protein ClpS
MPDKSNVATAPLAARPRPEPDAKQRHAPRYRVFIHNDDVTPMDFVVDTLRGIFHKPQTEAIEIMLQAHKTGVAHVITLPLEQAEFRVDQAHSLARTRKYPLKLTYEPEE